MQASVCKAAGCTFEPLYIDEALEAEKSIDSEFERSTVLASASPTIGTSAFEPSLQSAPTPPTCQYEFGPLSEHFAEPLMFGLTPNISGAANFRHGNIEASAGIITNAYGSLEWNASVSSEGSTFTHSASVSYPADRLDFQAELSNASYQGNKLQPAALQTLACIRVQKRMQARVNKAGAWTVDPEQIALDLDASIEMSSQESIPLDDSVLIG